MINSNKKNWNRNQNTPSSTTSKEKQCWRCNKKGHNTKECRTDKDKLYCKFCKATGHVSEACKKEKSRKNGTSKPNNTQKARQMTEADTPVTRKTRLTNIKLVEPSSRAATATRSTV